MAITRSLWFVAEGKTQEGEERSISVYRQGSSIYLSGGIFTKEHLCHQSVDSREKVEGEILVVYGVKVEKILESFDINRQLNQHTLPKDKSKAP